jgi:hypothetical protein
MTLSALICGVVLTNCGGSGNRTTDRKVEDNDTIVALDVVSVKLDPLKNETMRLKGKDPFGQVIPS